MRPFWLCFHNFLIRISPLRASLKSKFGDTTCLLISAFAGGWLRSALKRFLSSHSSFLYDKVFAVWVRCNLWNWRLFGGIDWSQPDKTKAPIGIRGLWILAADVRGLRLIAAAPTRRRSGPGNRGSVRSGRNSLLTLWYWSCGRAGQAFSSDSNAASCLRVRHREWRVRRARRTRPLQLVEHRERLVAFARTWRKHRPDNTGRSSPPSRPICFGTRDGFGTALRRQGVA